MEKNFLLQKLSGLLAGGHTRGEAAAGVGIHRQTLLRWRWESVAVSEQIKRALELGQEKRRYRLWLRHPFRGVRPPTGRGHGGEPAYY